MTILEDFQVIIGETKLGNDGKEVAERRVDAGWAPLRLVLVLVWS